MHMRLAVMHCTRTVDVFYEVWFFLRYGIPRNANVDTRKNFISQNVILKKTRRDYGLFFDQVKKANRNSDFPFKLSEIYLDFDKTHQIILDFISVLTFVNDFKQ